MSLSALSGSSGNAKWRAGSKEFVSLLVCLFSSGQLHEADLICQSVVQFYFFRELASRQEARRRNYVLIWVRLLAKIGRLQVL